MKDIGSITIENIVDGWKLRDGRLYLMVRCEDDVVRTVIIPDDPRKQTEDQPT